ncbi:enoyl-CoA hydratase-related protein [Alkalibacterium sp. f15]|uniref:enoyl-CoA hydratase-related protein n=1 Tax=Alkalibacterium sp. f15 TaxID=3414029 RepID=UPI003BF84239
MTKYDTLKFSKSKGIGTLTINRPKNMNALNMQVLRELNIILEDIGKDEAVQVLIVTGSGEKAFVAGADINEMKDKNASEGREFSTFGNKVFSKLENLRQPSIAAVNGFALGGGCELAMACDVRIGAENAKFGQPEVGLGIIPGFGGTQRLSRIVGLSKAKELIYTAKTVNAEEAFNMNLLNKITESSNLMAEARLMAQSIIKQAPLAIEASKIAINHGYEMDLSHALEMEAELFGGLFATADQKEGMTAFTEKIKAVFNRQ